MPRLLVPYHGTSLPPVPSQRRFLFEKARLLVLQPCSARRVLPSWLPSTCDLYILVGLSVSLPSPTLASDLFALVALDAFAYIALVLPHTSVCAHAGFVA